MDIVGPERPVALVTGGSRGIGAATALALARRGYDVALTYHNKAARAEEVVCAAVALDAEAMALACDITVQSDVDNLFAELRDWAGRLDVLSLNASGGLERAALAADPIYPTRINRDAQLAVLEGALPLMAPGGTVVFVTSHWAHRYGQVQQLPAYEGVAESKHAGEVALRARQGALAARGIRLLVVTGDLIEGTITPRLLERAARGKPPGAGSPTGGQDPVTADRAQRTGPLPTAEQMGEAIAAAAADPALPSGHTLIVGGALDSLPRL